MIIKLKTWQTKSKSRTLTHPNFQQFWGFILLELHARCSVRDRSGKGLARQHAGIWALSDWYKHDRTTRQTPYLKILPCIFQSIDCQLSAHQESKYFTVQTESSRSKNQSNWPVHLVTQFETVECTKTWHTHNHDTNHISQFGTKRDLAESPQTCQFHLVYQYTSCKHWIWYMSKIKGWSWQEGDGAIAQF